MIKAVFFDWGVTLVSGFTDIDKEINDVLEKYGIKWDDFFRHWRNFYHLRSVNKIKTDQEMFDIMRKIFGFPDNSPLEKIRELEIKSHIIEPETIETIRELKKNYKIGIISNNIYEWVMEVLKRYGIADLFDSVIVSSKVGARKPDGRIFYAALKSLSVKPEESVFISDELAEDLLGSKGLGIISIWLAGTENKSHWKAKEGIDNEEKIFEPDFTIHKIKEIPKLLKK